MTLEPSVTGAYSGITIRHSVLVELVGLCCGGPRTEKVTKRGNEERHPLTTTKRYLSESSQLAGKMEVSSASFNSISRAFLVFLESLMVLSLVTDSKESASLWKPRVDTQSPCLKSSLVPSHDTTAGIIKKESKCGFYTVKTKVRGTTECCGILV